MGIFICSENNDITVNHNILKLELETIEDGVRGVYICADKNGVIEIEIKIYIHSINVVKKHKIRSNEILYTRSSIVLDDNCYKSILYFDDLTFDVEYKKNNNISVTIREEKGYQK